MFYKKQFLTIGVLLSMLACIQKNKNSDNISSQFISDPQRQDTLFRKLIDVTNNTIPESKWNDSLFFLILPVEAACPSCRKKTIDSIVKYKDKLDDRHFVVVTGTGNKIIASYFAQQSREVPHVHNKIFIDSVNKSFIRDLVFTHPAIYYSANGKVFRKKSCTPTTIKGDLREFFAPL